jgi:hypothetical protein
LDGPDKLTIDLESRVYRYSFVLERHEGERFSGNWTCTHNGVTSSDRATATLYQSSTGYFLFGTWVEEGSNYYWWVELDAVEHFPDEVRE